MAANLTRVMISGAGGFVGSVLTRALAASAVRPELILVDRSGGQSGDGGLSVLPLDVADPERVDAVVRECKPDAFIHLAAISAVAHASSDQRLAWQVNTLGTLNVVLSLQKHAPRAHMIYISSAEVYGRSAFSGVPVNEQARLQPANPYAASKAAADLMVQEAAGRGLFCTVLRPFNHTGPGQSDHFAIPSFCRQIALIEAGLAPPLLKVGELNDQRDFLDVADVCDLYLRVLNAGRSLPSGLILNVASGTPHRVGTLLDKLLSMSTKKIQIEVDPGRLRASRVPTVVGDPSQAENVLGWRATTSIDQTLAATLAYWRGRTGATTLNN